jgi:plasmid stabilization system protein ParE
MVRSAGPTECPVTVFAVDLLPEAEAEIGEAFHWYFERSAMAAQAFRAEVFAAIDHLATDALMWPEDADAFRRYILRHFPYTIFYELDGTTVTVMAVAHHRRKPGYWRKR